MATCEKCGKEYLTRECLRCKEKENNPLTEKEKLYKTIRYAIIFFIGVFGIGTLIEIYIIKKTTDITEPIMKETFKSLELIHKMNERTIKEINKGFKNPFEDK